MGCLGQLPLPYPGSNKNIISINCLPYQNQDCILDKESISKKSVSNRKMESVKKLPLEVRIEERPETNQNVIVPIFE